jgi:YHS domain-containing protein
MTKDPVCGMEVDEKNALTSTYRGNHYAFCSPDCKQAFDREPEKYAGSRQPENVGKT